MKELSGSIRHDQGTKGIKRQEQMRNRKAGDETITRLFKMYTKQGIKNHKAIMLIAASLGLLQKDVLDILEQRGVYDT